MATTPNFNWSTPDNTGLVKNGALDIRTLGNAIDASMADLKGGTTGQVLAKATNTDMDFTWVAQDDSNAIQNAIVDAKGDLIAATAADTPARLAVGTNGQVLTASSGASTGLAWAAPSGMTLLSTTTLSGASTTISSISSAYRDLRIIIGGVTNLTASGNFTIKHNGYSDSQYITYNDNSNFTTKQNGFYSTRTAVVRSDPNNLWDLTIGNYASTSLNFKSVRGSQVYVGSDGVPYDGNIGGGWYVSAAAVSSLTFANTGGDFAGGTVLLYGVN